MHQWTYKDSHIREMVTKPSDRAEIVRVATEAFGGTLHQFFLAFGEYDGVAIAEFPDATTAMACMMSVYGQGGLSLPEDDTFWSPPTRASKLRQWSLRRTSASAALAPLAGARNHGGMPERLEDSLLI
jgi:uncharacterized protein with GYD domain